MGRFIGILTVWFCEGGSSILVFWLVRVIKSSSVVVWVGE